MGIFFNQPLSGRSTRINVKKGYRTLPGLLQTVFCSRFTGSGYRLLLPARTGRGCLYTLLRPYPDCAPGLYRRGVE